MTDIDAIAKVIADNLPRPYALNIVWHDDGRTSQFDLSQADEASAEEWRSMARAVIAAVNKS